MKNEWTWLAGCGLASILIVGWLTGFKFGELEIATREVVGSFGAIIFFTGALYTAKNLYLGVDLMLDNRVLAILLSIINPIVAMLILIFVYFNLQGPESFIMLYPGADHSGRLVPILLFTGVLAFQAFIEVKALRRIRVFLQSK